MLLYYFPKCLCLQETFRGCADICIGSNCPQGECAKIGSTGGGGNNGGTGGGVITPPTRPPAPGPTICTFAGIKQQYFSPAGDQYCQQTCAGKLQQVLFGIYVSSGRWVVIKNKHLKIVVILLGYQILKAKTFLLKWS